MTKGDKWYNYHVADVTKVNAIVTDANGKQYSSEKKLESAASTDWYCENGKWSKYNPDEPDPIGSVDMREETIYFVMTTRFYDGDTGNDVHCWDDGTAGNGDDDPAWRGDFKGLGEKLDYILEMRAKDPMHCKPYADKFGVEFVAGEKCWGVKDVDVYMPAATQNDVRMESAEKIAASGVKYYIEVANMPTTNDALNFLRAQKHMVVAGLEMSQNSERLSWTAEEVDAQLHKMMKNIHKVSAEAAEEYGLGYDLVAGANIAGFKKVAEAMYEQGVF